METIFIDGALMLSRGAAHAHLAERLRLPDSYGRNLDALYDLLTERGEPVRLVLRRRADMEAALGGYGSALLRTMEEAAEENPALELVVEGT